MSQAVFACQDKATIEAWVRQPILLVGSTAPPADHSLGKVVEPTIVVAAVPVSRKKGLGGVLVRGHGHRGLGRRTRGVAADAGVAGGEVVGAAARTVPVPGAEACVDGRRGGHGVMHHFVHRGSGPTTKAGHARAEVFEATHGVGADPVPGPAGAPRRLYRLGIGGRLVPGMVVAGVGRLVTVARRCVGGWVLVLGRRRLGLRAVALEAADSEGVVVRLTAPRRTSPVARHNLGRVGIGVVLVGVRILLMRRVRTLIIAKVIRARLVIGWGLVCRLGRALRSLFDGWGRRPLAVATGSVSIPVPIGVAMTVVVGTRSGGDRGSSSYGGLGEIRHGE